MLDLSVGAAIANVLDLSVGACCIAIVLDLSVGAQSCLYLNVLWRTHACLCMECLEVMCQTTPTPDQYTTTTTHIESNDLEDF